MLLSLYHQYRVSMLRSSLSLPNLGVFSASLPAVQQVLGVAQKCCSYATKSTKSAPYVKDAEKAKAKATAKADKEKRKPRRAPSAYNLFVKDKAAGLAAGTAADRMTILAQQWNSMSTADKAPYVEMAAEGALEANKVSCIICAATLVRGVPCPGVLQRPYLCHLMCGSASTIGTRLEHGSFVFSKIVLFVYEQPAAAVQCL